jgi:hypothetical protein
MVWHNRSRGDLPHIAATLNNSLKSSARGHELCGLLFFSASEKNDAAVGTRGTTYK